MKVELTKKEVELIVAALYLRADMTQNTKAKAAYERLAKKFMRLYAKSH